MSQISFAETEHQNKKRKIRRETHWKRVVLHLLFESRIIFVFLSFLFLVGCDSYDSFSECMNDYEARSGSADAVCPECNNDWRELRQEAVKRCSKYRKSY